MSVDHTDCPLCEAPPCFKYALTRSLERAISDFAPTNWRGFADHFRVDINPSTNTPEDLISYWVDCHPSKHNNTIKSVMEFAKKSQHKLLEEEMTTLVSAHLVADHNLRTTPPECLAPCDKCIGWDMSGGQRNCDPHIDEDSTPQEDSPDGHQCVSYNYNGPVTNHIYNVLQQTPTEDASDFQFSVKDVHLVTSKTPPHSHTVTGSPPTRLHTVTGAPLPPPHIVTGTPPTHPHIHTIKKHTSNLKDCPQETNTEKQDILQNLGQRLFDDVFPYKQLQKYYKGKTKEAVRVILIIFLLYQSLAVIVMSICENGGLLAMFRTDENKRYSAVVCRLITFTLRFLVRVVTPLCLSLHISTMASKPKIPWTGLSQAQALPRMFKVHEHFSSEEEVVELKKNPETVFKRSEEMTKRRIKAMWISIVNAVFFIALLLYLGAFLVCESNVMRGGVCNSLDRTIINIPFVDFQIHIIIVIESFSVFIILLLAGITTNCYYHENTIARYAVTIGKETESVHYDVRRRWAIMDWYSVLVPVILSLVTILSISTGQPFSPAPTHTLEAGELVDWYFWIVDLTVLQYFAFSCNRMVKNACLWCFVLSVVFVYTVEVEVSIVPYGSICLLLYCWLSAICSNCLFSLCVCHLCHARDTLSVSSWVWFLCCFLSLSSLIVCLVITVYREVAHLTSFVHIL